MDYILHLCILALIYSTLATSLDLLVGHTGLISIAHAAFYGIGAYATALLSVRYGLSFPLCVLASVFVSTSLSLLISLPTLRLRGDHFVLGTFALQVIAHDVFNNWIDITKGPLGIPGIPIPDIFGWRVNSQIQFVLLASIFAGIAFSLVTLLTSAPFGRVLHAIREDDLFVSSTGHNALWFKVCASAVSASLASLAGAIYASYITYIDPTSFTVTQSILVLAMVIIGGAGSRYGPIVGAVVLLTLPEGLRFVGLNDNIAAHLREVIYGGTIVFLMMFRPQGIAGRYRFD